MAGLFAFELAWYPGVAGILTVAVATIVLCGSVWLLVGTNTGFRLGFLISLASFFGFMVLLGGVWWLYGIGLVGDAPSWRVHEIVRSADPDDLSMAATPEARDIGDWEELDLADPEVGEAQAAADGVLTDPNLGGFEAANDYVVLRALHFGGDPMWLGFRQTREFITVQVQAAVPVTILDDEDEPCPEGHDCIVFGEAPPTPRPQEDAPTVSAVLLRDQGSIRLPPALITVGSLIVFLILCHALHRRDQIAAAQRAAEPVPANGRTRTPA